MRLSAGFLHVASHTRVAGKVLFDVVRSRAAFDAEVLRQPESTHAVDEAEIDHLGHAALLGRHRIGLNAEDFGCSCAVNVLAVAESLQQPRILRNMRHDAQFDLRVVGRNDAAAGLGNESLTHAPPLGGAHRNVLQIGLGTRKASRDGRRLAEGCVHAMIRWIGHLRQFVGIGILEFRKCPKLQDELGQRIVEREFGEHLFVG